MIAKALSCPMIRAKQKFVAAQAIIKEKSDTENELEGKIKSLHDLHEELEEKNFTVAEQHRLDVRYRIYFLIADLF